MWVILTGRLIGTWHEAASTALITLVHSDIDSARRGGGSSWDVLFAVAFAIAQPSI